jgi:hypothetical protein
LPGGVRGAVRLSGSSIQSSYLVPTGVATTANAYPAAALPHA